MLAPTGEVTWDGPPKWNMECLAWTVGVAEIINPNLAVPLPAASLLPDAAPRSFNPRQLALSGHEQLFCLRGTGNEPLTAD